MEMPDLDKIVDTVCSGIELVDKGMDPTDAASFINKIMPCGLVDDYVREYIIKSKTARDSGEVALDSAGERKGRVQKIIEKVADKVGFDRPTFKFKYATNTSKSNEPVIQEEPQMDGTILDEILTRIKKIEQRLNCAEVKIVAHPEGLTSWEELHNQCKEVSMEAKKQ